MLHPACAARDACKQLTRRRCALLRRFARREGSRATITFKDLVLTDLPAERRWDPELPNVNDALQGGVQAVRFNRCGVCGVEGEWRGACGRCASTRARHAKAALGRRAGAL